MNVATADHQSECHAYIQQGSWSSIALLAYKDKESAIAIAHDLELTPQNIHEFDWEKLEEVYGSKQEFLDEFYKG
jgi:hypothetical protein